MRFSNKMMSESVALVFLIISTFFCVGSPFHIQPRIINGESSERGQFPYFVHIEITRRFEPQMYTQCGGTLIDSRFILTAAHCLMNTKQIAVHLGSLRQLDREKGRQVFFVKPRDFYIHPQYDDDAVPNLNDIALIKLPRPVEFSEFIQPVSFSNACEIPADVELIAMGNGYNASGVIEIVEILQYTTLKTIPHSECLGIYGCGVSVFCAEGAYNNSICQGDSGAGLIDPVDHALYGIASFTADDDVGCEAFPQGFTNVLHYLNWITEITGIQFEECDITEDLVDMFKNNIDLYYETYA